MTIAVMETELTADYQQQALETLKQKGFRITRPRRLVIELLDKSIVPLSAYDIKAHLDVLGDKVDTVSVYRILDCLEDNGLIHRVLSSGKVQKCQLRLEDHCKRDQQDHCHHLLICKQCKQVQEVHCPGMETLIQAIESDSGYILQSHHLEFIGLCHSCQQA